MKSTRPSYNAAMAIIRGFLAANAPEHRDEHVRLVEDGEDGWAWWIFDDDTTSYVHHDLTVEWYGHTPPEEPCPAP